MFRLATCDFFSRGLGLRHCGRGSAAPCGRRLRPCGRPRQKTHLAAVFFFTLRALAVHVGAARAVDLHPLVHERGDLCVRGSGEGKEYE